MYARSMAVTILEEREKGSNSNGSKRIPSIRRSLRQTHRQVDTEGTARMKSDPIHHSGNEREKGIEWRNLLSNIAHDLKTVSEYY